MPTWPVSLPQYPLQEGYKEAPGANVIESQVDAGPPKRRRRYTKRNDPHTMIFELDDTQLATFKSFYGTTLQDGNLSFDYVHPAEAVLATWQFQGQPEYRSVGGPLYQVVCQLLRTG